MLKRERMLARLGVLGLHVERARLSSGQTQTTFSQRSCRLAPVGEWLNGCNSACLATHNNPAESCGPPGDACVADPTPELRVWHQRSNRPNDGPDWLLGLPDSLCYQNQLRCGPRSVSRHFSLLRGEVGLEWQKAAFDRSERRLLALARKSSENESGADYNSAPSCKQWLT